MHVCMYCTEHQVLLNCLKNSSDHIYYLLLTTGGYRHDININRHFGERGHQAVAEWWYDEETENLTEGTRYIVQYKKT